MGKLYHVVVIGGGPAGISASMFLADHGLDVLICDAQESQAKSAWIENYLGFEKGISGNEIIYRGFQQLNQREVPILNAEVQNIISYENYFDVITEEQNYKTKYIILACGQKKGLKIAEDVGLSFEENQEPFTKMKIKINEYFETSIENIYACGTAIGVSSQAIIAAGNGAQVALNILSQLEGKRVHHHKTMST